MKENIMIWDGRQNVLKATIFPDQFTFHISPIKMPTCFFTWKNCCHQKKMYGVNIIFKICDKGGAILSDSNVYYRETVQKWFDTDTS